MSNRLFALGFLFFSLCCAYCAFVIHILASASLSTRLCRFEEVMISFRPKKKRGDD